MPSRTPLRLRVALAFAVTTAAALAGLGAFVYLRVDASLNQQLRDTLDGQLELLVDAPAARRPGIVTRMVGESFGQVLSANGDPVVSSPQVSDGLLGAGDLPAVDGLTEVDREVVLDDDGAAEREAAMLLVRRSGNEVLVVGTSRDEADRALVGVGRQLLIGVPLALLFASGLGYLVAGSALRPIELMRARAASISSQSRGERLPLPRADDEVRRLGVTLNAMLDRLDEGIARQRRFVAEASHELRTPLALLRMELDLALARPRSQEELAAAIESASEEVERLIRLAQDLLTLAAIDEGGFELDRSTFDLVELIDEVVRRFAATSQSEGRSIRVDAPGQVLVNADRSRFDQVIANLLDNALRHGGGGVTVTAQSQGQQIRMDVADNGRGFSTEFRDRAFERFSNDDAEHRGAHGLGLSIVHAIVSEHGGSVSIGAADAGAVVTVVL